MEFITRLGQKKKSRFFRELFFSGDYTPPHPRGGLPPNAVPPPGTTPPRRAIFFLNFFSLKNNFFSSKTGTWVTFLVDWGQRKNIFRLFFFGSDLWGTHFGTPPPWTPFGPLLGPILDALDPFWAHFGPILDTLDPFWTILDHFGHFG